MNGALARLDELMSGKLERKAVAQVLSHLVLLLEQAAAPQPKFLTLKEASSYTGLSVTCLRRLIAAGRLNALRDGRLKVPREQLDGLSDVEELARLTRRRGSETG